MKKEDRTGSTRKLDYLGIGGLPFQYRFRHGILSRLISLPFADGRRTGSGYRKGKCGWQKSLRMRTRHDFDGSHIAGNLIEKDSDDEPVRLRQTINHMIGAKVLMPIKHFAAARFEMKLRLVEINSAAEQRYDHSP